MNKIRIILPAAIASLFITLIIIGTFIKVNDTPIPTSDSGFRVALSLGQDIHQSIENGVQFKIDDTLISSEKELQKAYIEKGATEMYVRIATKRYDDNDSKEDPYHGKIHNLEVALKHCKLAAELGIPINPELMCAYTYMDGFTSQAPDFKEYPEIKTPDKPWSEYTLDEMCDVLEQYGALVAKEILDTGCTVEYWNLGNEANYGFAGVALGLETNVNPDLKNKSMYDLYTMDHIGADFLKENVWNYNAKMMMALEKGIRSVQKDAKFSTHVSCQNDVYFNTTYYSTLLEEGLNLDQAGISVYPTSEFAKFYPDYMGDMKRVIQGIYETTGLPVFIAEYAYPSENMNGEFGNWDTPVKGYSLSDEDQAAFTKDFILWCKDNHVSGIRFWGPDVLGDWTPMSFYSYDGEQKIATAKPVMDIITNAVSD